MKKLFKITFMFMVTFMLSFSLVGQNYNLTTYEVGYLDTTNHGTFSSHDWTSPVITQGSGTVGYTEDTIYGYSTTGVTTQGYWELEMEKEFNNNELIYGDIKVTIRLYAIMNATNDNIKLYYIDDNGGILNTSNNSHQIITPTGPIEYTYTFNKQNGVSIKKLKIAIDGYNTSQYYLYGLKIEVDETTNIQENIANNFNVYSYNKNLVVKTTALENYSIRIYNLSGQEVLVKNAQGNQEIPLTLTTGMYIVNINNGKESYNQKVMVQ